MTRATVTMFGMDTIKDYMSFCGEAVCEFEADQGSVVRGFTAILALNHLPDWLQCKLTPAEAGVLHLPHLTSGGTEVKIHFEALSADVTLVRELANGFKHLKRSSSGASTEAVSGYGVGPYGVGPFGSDYLLIDRGPGVTAADQYEDAFSVCQRLLAWWNQQLAPIVV